MSAIFIVLLIYWCYIIDIDCLSPSSISTISIRGHPETQKLPISLSRQWKVYTYDFQELTSVENEDLDDQKGWIYPSSFDTLYLPSDLPPPLLAPALGVVVVHGTPRYIMPSTILSLQTPDKAWRNRGVCSLPRAFAWIDLFGPFTPALEHVRNPFVLSC